jgi:putative hemolysin
MERETNQKNLVDTANFIARPFSRELYRFLLQPGVERLLGIRRLNELYRRVSALDKKFPSSGLVTFAEAVLQSLNIKWEIKDSDLEQLRKIEGPVVLLANHPFGGIEAIFLVLLLEKIRPDYRIMANFMLSQIPEIKDKLILVDPFQNESSAKNNTTALKETLRWLSKGQMLGIFPSGEVAAWDWKTGKIQEPSWSPHIGRILMRAPAAVVPVYFAGHNSLGFHLAGLVHKRLRTSLLIREFVNPATQRIIYRIGKPIPVEKIQSFTDPEALTKYLQSKTYILAPTTSSRFKLSLLGRRFSKQQPIAPPRPQEEIENALLLLSKENCIYRQGEWELWKFGASGNHILIQEIGRLREVAFRQVQEGSGKSRDLDVFDEQYEHLLLWNTQQKEIIGAYRLWAYYPQKRETSPIHYLPSLFRFQPAFYRELAPFLELGRAFVTPAYQKNYNALLLLWKGIGRYLLQNPEIKYLIGAVSISNNYHPLVKDLIIRYLKQNHWEQNLAQWVKPQKPYRFLTPYGQSYYEALAIQNLTDLQELLAEIDAAENKIPILLKHYLRLGGKIVGFNIDPQFSDALDALLVVELSAVPQSMKAKFMPE